MRSLIRKAQHNPLRTVVKTVAIIALLVVCVRAAYAQGVRHAILTASSYTEGNSILIDFGGQVHEYSRGD